MAEETRCPPFGTGSVDFTQFHADLKKGRDPDEALADATVRVGPVEEPPAPPSLSGKTKAELLDIAAAEGVTADESMTNQAIVDAIEDARGAA